MSFPFPSPMDFSLMLNRSRVDPSRFNAELLRLSAATAAAAGMRAPLLPAAAVPAPLPPPAPPARRRNTKKGAAASSATAAASLGAGGAAVGAVERALARPRRKGMGRRKIAIRYIRDKIKRRITFSKRKSGIMKKAYELATLTGVDVLVLISSETGHVYTFATPKFRQLITNNEGKAIIRRCLSAPNPEPVDMRDQMPPESPSMQTTTEEATAALQAAASAVQAASASARLAAMDRRSMYAASAAARAPMPPAQMQRYGTRNELHAYLQNYRAMERARMPYRHPTEPRHLGASSSGHYSNPRTPTSALSLGSVFRDAAFLERITGDKPSGDLNSPLGGQQTWQ